MLKNEWKAIFKHKFLLVVLIALAIVPALYNWIFLSSMWDPYGKLDQLPVAVVNQDKATSLNGKRLSVGQQVTDEMKKDKKLDYHFVNKADADKGIKDGKYYLVVNFPENFSKDAASLMTGSPVRPVLNYQTAQGHNYISGKMSDSAMASLKDELSKNISQEYSRALISGISELKSGMNKASDGSAELQDATGKAESGSNELTQNLGKLSDASLSFSDGTQELSVGLSQYLDATKAADQGANQLASASQQYVSGVNQLSQGTDQLNSKSADMKAGIGQLTASVPEVEKLSGATKTLKDGLEKLSQATSLPAEQAKQISDLETGLDQLNQAIQTGDASLSADIQKEMTSLQTALTALPTEESQAIMGLPDLSVQQKTEVLQALQASTKTSMDQVQTSMQGLAQDLTALNQEQEALKKASNQALPGAHQAIDQLKGGLDQTHDALSQQILPGASQISDGAGQLSSGLARGSSQLSSGFDQYASAVGQINDGAQTLKNKGGELQSGSQQLATGLDQLTNKSGELQSGSDQLSTGAQGFVTGSQALFNGSDSLNKGLTAINSGEGKLHDSLADASDKLQGQASGQDNADKITSPVSLKHVDTSQSEVNGVGMAPYMIAVALFVGAISTNIMFGASLSKKTWKSGRDLLLAKLGTNGVVAVLQALIVTGAVYVLGLRASQGFLGLFGANLLISFAFMAIVTFLNLWLGKVGAFVSLVLLIIQLAASAGTYPIQLSAKIFQIINPWLPMSYAIKLLRQMISLNGTGWAYAGLMIALALVFTGLIGIWGRSKRQAI
ncbi:YhgE/Pip domain-containing protein [Lactococcus termiticola]|uniref:YhgE/Pip N-terminal domain protein n=1 Tax=Lactococcus termiticola TaxID=2169526 RepID=A0A2R5HJC1_9LACT|nr:YhgE/Pip domain-containing protein [Lactococcus termiticola]GBG96311.1 YhgE/Pip N-terminal domain protein [Lactococcus termiticola]